MLCRCWTATVGIARIILVNICPCRAGIRKRPWQVPSSPSNIVNVVRRSALASSASSAFRVESLGVVGGDHLEGPPAQDAECFGVVVLSQRYQVGLGGSSLFGVDRELARGREPVEGGHDRPRLDGVDLAFGPGAAARSVVLVQCLGEAEVGAGVAADLTGSRPPASPQRGRHRTRRWRRIGRPRRGVVARAPRAAPWPGAERSAPRAGAPASSTRAVSGTPSRAAHAAGGLGRAPGGGGRPAGCS